MKDKITQIFNKLFPPAICQHDKWIDVGEVHLYRLLPDIIELQDYSIFISGINAKECVACHILSPVADEADRLLSLKEMAGNLMKLHNPSERITISFGDIASKKDNKVGKKKTPVSLVEEATITAKPPLFGMESVILNESTQNHLEEALLKIEGAVGLYKDIGYEKIRPYNQATIILCYGPPGTGKTMAAQAIASYRNTSFIDINLADIESRFMSQTSKNISKAFKTAMEKNAVLFFDEADTMLGTRLSEVNHGVDAEINMSRSTMLKELEQFQGICLFATNFESNIDQAFVRRITHHIEFGLPELETRRKFWDYCLLEKFKLEDNRTDLIEKLTLWSDKLSGADIVRVLELAYFKAYRYNKISPLITNTILQESIVQIKKANETIGKKKQIPFSSGQSEATSKLGANTFTIEDYSESDPKFQLARMLMGLSPSVSAINGDEKASLK